MNRMYPVLDLPPLGMCGSDKPQYKFEHFIPRIIIEKKGNNLSLENQLGEWNIPEIIIILKSKRVNIEVKACIDTGSYYSHAKEWIIDKLDSKQSYFASGNNPEYGIITTPTFNIDFSINGIDAELNSSFMIMLPTFNYDVILGAHLFDVFSLNIDSKKRKFILTL